MANRGSIRLFFVAASLPRQSSCHSLTRLTCCSSSSFIAFPRQVVAVSDRMTHCNLSTAVGSLHHSADATRQETGRQRQSAHRERERRLVGLHLAVPPFPQRSPERRRHIRHKPRLKRACNGKR